MTPEQEAIFSDLNANIAALAVIQEMKVRLDIHTYNLNRPSGESRMTFDGLIQEIKDPENNETIDKLKQT
jgi:hypothetical protein